MYSSPVTPGGTGRNRSSSTYSPVFHNGRPMGTVEGTSSPRDIGFTDENTVVSVGPYSLATTIPWQASRTRLTAAWDTTSPPAHSSRTPAKHPGSSSASVRNRPALTNRPVTPPSVIASANSAAPSLPGEATTTVPPVSSGTQISKVDASNANGECISTASWFPRPQYELVARCTTLRCVLSTPFGVPVDPEVYMTYTACSGWVVTSGRMSGYPSVTPSSVIRTVPMPAGATAVEARSVSSSTTSASSAVHRDLASGCVGSNGT